MVEQGHYAAKDIHRKLRLLQDSSSNLKELVETRGERLKDAVLSLQVKSYYFCLLNVFHVTCCWIH